MEQFRFACPCGFGLESVLSGELKRLGREEVAAADGRVDFTGTAEDLARANLWLRTAERVLLVLGSFRAVTFTQLFDGVAALPLERFIGKRDRFPVKGWSLNSQLHSVPDCQSIIKKAAVKRLGAQYGIQWFEETGALYQLQFSIHRDTVTIMLDTTGPGLHKRGYRRVQNQAPIRETLAAGILDLVRIYPDTRLYDPFCGSGTFLIEGAYKAKNIAPGLYRRFAAEHWGWIPGQVWREKQGRHLPGRGQRHQPGGAGDLGGQRQKGGGGPHGGDEAGGHPGLYPPGGEIGGGLQPALRGAAAGPVRGGGALPGDGPRLPPGGAGGVRRHQLGGGLRGAVRPSGG